MHFRLFIVTLERFCDVSYKRYIDLLFDYHYLGITVDSVPHHHSTVVISVDRIHITTIVFILFQTPILRLYRGIHSTTVNTVLLLGFSLGDEIRYIYVYQATV